MYIVTSKPRRMSINSGLVHIGILHRSIGKRLAGNTVRRVRDYCRPARVARPPENQETRLMIIIKLAAASRPGLAQPPTVGVRAPTHRRRAQVFDK
jgi:hypothetical protein